MKDVSWYWHRLTAMGPAEIGLHARKKVLQKLEMTRPTRFPTQTLQPNRAFPALLYPTTAPAELKQSREEQWKSIRAGRWTAFAWLPLQVDLPPYWQKDYKAGVDLESIEHGFRLNHRKLPNGADVKLVWELSRWHEISRAAQYAWLGDSKEAAQACKKWLRDWVARNPPYRGYNWTSALESGMRLIQLVWIDALLQKFALPNWGEVISDIVFPHLHYTWNFRSFGSSANNHLLGELAGVIMAVTHWPELKDQGVSLETLRPLFEKEVLAQFASDGGNLEQALNYQLFSLEFCWLSKLAFEAAKLPLNPEVEKRLRLAGKFFAGMHVANESWPYGDSDDAYVFPFFLENKSYREEWQSWLRDEPDGDVLRFWIGSFSREKEIAPTEKLQVWPESGHAIQRKADWTVRWDFSPLGYLSTAAHGHIDALHVSLWFKGAAIIIDPGTGAYYGDTTLRNFLASPLVHNGPWPSGWNQPKRLGPFLWSNHHLKPKWLDETPGNSVMEWDPGCGIITRVSAEAPSGWEFIDSYHPRSDANSRFEIYWQFAPGLLVETTATANKFLIKNGPQVIEANFSQNFDQIELVKAGEAKRAGQPVRGICSPAFRSVTFGDGIKLTGTGGNSCLFTSRFIALSPQ
ncbi:MAG: heparinase II/III domain-containing protein [Verrucomicrobiales bacterium]